MAYFFELFKKNEGKPLKILTKKKTSKNIEKTNKYQQIPKQNLTNTMKIPTNTKKLMKIFVSKRVQGSSGSLRS